MTRRSFRAELLKLRHPRLLVGGGAALIGLTVLGTVLTFATAKRVPTAPDSGQFPAATFAQLARPSGLTQGFANAIGMVGILAFVLFLTSLTAEYGHGTLRVVLTRNPRRAQFLAGKALALIAVTAGALLAAELASAAVSIAMAHQRGIPTGDWVTGSGALHAATHYGNALLSCACYGLLGLTLAAAVRSTPLALGIGLAWLLPVERTLENSWSGAGHWLPGPLFGAIAGTGGTTTVPYGAAVVLALAYVTVALLAGGTSFMRRDVTT
jgi:ABC-2 type transport system permease protein